MLRSLGGDKIISRAYEKASAGSLEDALTILRRAARISDPKGDRWEAMGAILYQRGRWQDAAEAFEHSLDKDPSNMSRLNFLCSSLARAGNHERTMALLDKYQAQFPIDVAPPSIRCLILAEQQDYTAARAAYEKARQVFTQHHSQDCLSMGFLQECADIVTDFPRKAAEQ